MIKRKKVKKLGLHIVIQWAGGFDKPLLNMGANCKLISDINPYSNKALEILYQHKSVGDITKIEEQDIPEHDLLVGGFPCQPFSVAGKREGFFDTRGTLYFEIERIAKEKQPKYLLLENVEGLMSHNDGHTLKTILKSLNQIGYIFDFTLLNTMYYLPHNRNRIFILGVRKDLVKEEQWDLSKYKKNSALYKKKKDIQESKAYTYFDFEWIPQEEKAPHIASFVKEVAETYAYISSRMIQDYLKHIKEEDFKKGRHVLSPTKNGHSKCLTLSTKSSYTYYATMVKHRATVVYERFDKNAIPLHLKEIIEIKSVKLSDGSYLFIRKLTAEEALLLQGFTSEDYNKMIENNIPISEIYNLAGNAVSIPVIEAIIKSLDKRFSILNT